MTKVSKLTVEDHVWRAFMRRYQTGGVLVLAFLVILLFLYTILLQNTAVQVKSLGLSDFLSKVDAHYIQSVKVQGTVLEATPNETGLQVELKKHPNPGLMGLNPLAPAASPTTAPATATDATSLVTVTTPEMKTATTTPSSGMTATTATTPPTITTPPPPPAGTAIMPPAGTTATPASSPMSRLLSVNELDRKQPKLRYHVELPSVASVDSLLPRLEQHKVSVTIEPVEKSGQWMASLSVLILPLALLAILYVVFRNLQSGGSQAMSFGKSRAKLMVDSKVQVTFKDVAGIDEAKAELEEVVDFLKNADRYIKLGAKIPKGVLLVGSPGTGKTLLAKAVAGEAGVPFFSISGSDFVEMFVGVGASRVRDLFEQAKKHAPCIVFVDEIDAVGRQRGAGMGGGHDEREQTLNQLLVEMDGFDGTTGIIIIAATNRPDILDNALLRPGRFDRQVVIDRPDLKGREQILSVHSKGKPIADDVDLKRLAKRTSGFTGADLSNLLNESALLAARRKKEIIDNQDVEDSIDRVVVGLEKKSKVISERDKEITAYHEAGHAITCLLTPGMDPLRKVTIVPRGMALGYAWYAPDDEMERTHTSKTRLLGEIAVALGGRVAEEIIFGDVCTGASSDLEKVTKIARSIVTRYGMSDKLGNLTYGQQNEHVFMGRDFGTSRDYSEEVAAEIDREIKRIVDLQHVYTRQLLEDNRDFLDAFTKALLEKETLNDDEIVALQQEVLARRKGTPSGEGTAADDSSVPPSSGTFASSKPPSSKSNETAGDSKNGGSASSWPGLGGPNPQPA
jgi:cell division protease FtsH